MIEDDEQETDQITKVSFPALDEIKQVVVLPSEHSGRQEVSKDKLIELEPFSSPELKPLSFTVDENFFDLKENSFADLDSKYANTNKFIEQRGLLQLIKERDRTKINIWDKEKNKTYKWIDEKHIGLQFPAKEGFRVSNYNEKYEEQSDLAKTRIHYEEIESVFLKEGFIKTKLIFKLKPEIQPHRLAIDKVEREITLHIARKDRELARQVVSAILTQVSEIELRKILK